MELKRMVGSSDFCKVTFEHNGSTYTRISLSISTHGALTCLQALVSAYVLLHASGVL